jgi:hypothetical protein
VPFVQALTLSPSLSLSLSLSLYIYIYIYIYITLSLSLTHTLSLQAAEANELDRFTKNLRGALIQRPVRSGIPRCPLPMTTQLNIRTCEVSTRSTL